MVGPAIFQSFNEDMWLITSLQPPILTTVTTLSAVGLDLVWWFLRESDEAKPGSLVVEISTFQLAM
jgi:hypothetical protein